MRLGDLDALKREFEDLFYNDVDDMERTERLIDNAPTVIVDNCGKCPYYKDRDRDIITEAYTEAYNDGYKTAKEDFENHKLVNSSQELVKDLVKEKNERPQGEWVRKEDLIHYIATQYSEHNELVPVWLSIGDMKGGAE